MEGPQPKPNFGESMSILRLFKSAAAKSARETSPSACPRLRVAELALLGAAAAAHIAQCDACRAEHLAVRAALACLVVSPPGHRETRPPVLRVVKGGRQTP